MYKKFDALIQRVTISLKNGPKPLDYKLVSGLWFMLNAKCTNNHW